MLCLKIKTPCKSRLPSLYLSKKCGSREEIETKLQHDDEVLELTNLVEAGVVADQIGRYPAAGAGG